ncbi:glycine receptor subunit alpha-2-like, partial [Limulus polyphemus]|uniref:Glycine receptor subunit alpha-2-like n=1 Tax=Limulus polyphemus TaxID=6850 RepID=A0ABM1THD7_LIMPO
MRCSCRSVPWSIIVCLVLVPEEVKCTSIGCNETTMYESIIPPGYQKVEPPVSEDGEFNVFISIQLYDIYGLNEETMDFFLHLYIFHIWQDSRLMLDCLTLKRPVKLPDHLTDQIWKPDIYFENSKAGSLFTTTVPNTNLKILQDNSVYLSARYLQHVSCPMYLRYYPMDVQSCQLRTGL